MKTCSEFELMKTVLFLCTGNYYRSRFAEIFFNWHARQRSLGWTAESRGLALSSANLGAMSLYTVSHLSDHSIPCDDYQRPPLDVTSADLELAAHVIAVKGVEHRPLVLRRFPEWHQRIEFWEVHDIDCALPSEAIPHLERQVLELLDRLNECGAAALVA
jgi:protein-tyrosine phosphatase